MEGPSTDPLPFLEGAEEPQGHRPARGLPVPTPWFGAPQENAPLPQFTMPVERYMSSPVLSIGPDADVSTAHATMAARKISSLAVVGPGGRLVGICSRSDLLRVGRREAGMRGNASLLTLPNRAVRSLTRGDVLIVQPDTPVSEAAAQMVRARVHRVVVAEDGRPVGIFSTRDVMTAICEKRLAVPLHAYMSTPVFTVRVSEPLSLATDRLAKARVSGLVVLEDNWPVGVFTQVEALEARDLEASTPVEAAMSSRFLSLGADTRLFRAAKQAQALGARRVLAVHGPRVEGVLTGLDFARAAT